MVRYRNITFNFDSNIFPEFLGASEYSMTASVFNRVFDEIKERGACPEWLLNHIEEIEDNIYNDTAQFDNADCFIYLVYMLNELNLECTIDCTYDHIIWLFHDIAHVVNDCTSTGIEVDESSECVAIEYSINACIDNKIPVPYEMLMVLQQEYKKRFKTFINFVEYARERDTYNFNDFNIVLA